MGVSMERRRDAIAIERLLETARAAERNDLRRLSLDRRLDGRVVKDRDLVCRPQPRQRGLELQRLLHRLMHERLDALFTPVTELTASKAADESFRAGETDVADFVRFAVEND